MEKSHTNPHVFQKVRCNISCRIGGSLFSVWGFNLHKISSGKLQFVIEVYGTNFQSIGRILQEYRSRDCLVSIGQYGNLLLLFCKMGGEKKQNNEEMAICKSFQ